MGRYNAKWNQNWNIGTELENTKSYTSNKINPDGGRASAVLMVHCSQLVGDFVFSNPAV